jgi:hypothetical protein
VHGSLALATNCFNSGLLHPKLMFFVYLQQKRHLDVYANLC